MNATMTLKEAIRAYWNAEKLLREAHEQDHDPFVLENRREDVKRYEALIEELQGQTTTLVLTGEGDCDYGDERVDLAAIEMLLQKGLIFECLRCEEDEDLISVYDGDHREFHLVDPHSSYCLDKALHEHDTTRWPEFFPPEGNEYNCEECGIEIAS